MKPFALVCIGLLLLAAQADARTHGDFRRLLGARPGRALSQASAAQVSQGSRSAVAGACVGNCDGAQARTYGSATGEGASTAGVSQVGSQVQTCQQAGDVAVECATSIPPERVSSCTDEAPGSDFTCQQQVQQYGKCGAPFMYLQAKCLKSCGRCGSGCTDEPPPASDGGAPGCDASKCNDKAVIAGPFCLKTCKRCSTSS